MRHLCSPTTLTVQGPLGAACCDENQYAAPTGLGILFDRFSTKMSRLTALLPRQHFPHAAAGGTQEPGVAQHLQFLPYLGLDVVVARMQLFEMRRKGKYLRIRKHGFVHGPNDREHLQSPTAFFDRKIFQRLDLAELFADDVRGRDGTVLDDGDAGIQRNAVEGEVAANPTGTARFG